MNNLELEYYIRKNPCLKNMNTKVYSPTTLPQRKIRFSRKSPRALILNLCKNEGCHWVGLVMFGPSSKYPNGHLEYYDPGGIMSYYMTEEIFKFVMNQQKPIVSNETRIQADSSTLCGKFVLVFLYLRGRGFSMEKINKQFDKKILNRNDIIVEEIFNSVFKNK